MLPAQRAEAVSLKRMEKTPAWEYERPSLWEVERYLTGQPGLYHWAAVSVQGGAGWGWDETEQELCPRDRLGSLPQEPSEELGVEAAERNSGVSGG